MVFGVPAGLAIREDILKTTNDASNFVPHRLQDLASEPLALTLGIKGLGMNAPYPMNTVLDVSGEYVRHGVSRGMPSYRHKVGSLRAWGFRFSTT